MSSILKNATKYVLMLGLGGLLFWYVLKDQDPNKIADDFRHANYFWIGVSVLISAVAYWSRAVRWNLLLEPLHIKPPAYKTFLALMSGYFANLLLPRAGEVARCLVLNKMSKAPFNSTFGSVVAERVFDLIGLLFVIGITFVFEFSLISGFLTDLFTSKFQNLFTSLQQMYIVLLILAIIAIAACAAIWFLREKIKQNTLFQKVSAFLVGVLQGIVGIKDLEKKWEFLFHSVLIWVCYYFMTYTVFFAFAPTAHLGMGAGLVLLVVGALGMSAPVPGGVGAFHFLVAGAMVVYGISKEDGVSYAILLHTSQALTVVVIGGMSFLISLLIGRNKETKYTDLNAE
jgi:uncharacterized protein (TIRG00374 family)